MALNSTNFFDIYPISPKSNRVAHPDSGMLGETLTYMHTIHVHHRGCMEYLKPWHDKGSELWAGTIQGNVW